MGEKELGDAEAVPDPFLDFGPMAYLFQSKPDHKLALPDPGHARTLRGTAQVLSETPHEPGAVLALQGQFVGFYDDMGYHGVILHNSQAARRPDAAARMKFPHPERVGDYKIK